MYASRFAIGAIALSFLVAGFGCKTGKAGKVPVQQRMTSFAPPEREDVFPDEEATEEEGSPDESGTEE